MISIDYNMVVFKEQDIFVAYSPKLDISSCGDSIDQAREMLKSAVGLFLEEAEKMGTVNILLKESGYLKIY